MKLGTVGCRYKRWFDSTYLNLALRTEPICSRNKCREHQSVCGVRWRKWKTHKDGRQRTTQSFHRKRNGRKDCRAEFDSQPAHSAELQSAEIRSLTLKSSANGILLCSSHKRRIGCMLRWRHSFHCALLPRYRYGGATFQEIEYGFWMDKNKRYILCV